jgi:hypothetical protein
MMFTIKNVLPIFYINLANCYRDGPAASISSTRSGILTQVEIEEPFHL